MSNEKAIGEQRIASLAMYRDPPPVMAATRALWAYLGNALRERGFADVPPQLDETIAHDAAWLDPRLLIAQSCGYPYASRLRGRVRLVATPIYEHPGCNGVMNGSVVIVPIASPIASIADLRGRTAAMNDPLSNSGMNLLRHLVAPHAIEGRFFGRVIESGGHVASLALVAGGEADVAAIDCVTYGNIARFAPEQVAGVRILAETAKTPGLPIITRGTASDEDVAILRDVLIGLGNDPMTKPFRDTLGLRGFEMLPDNAYDRILDIEREAVALGYPQLI